MFDKWSVTTDNYSNKNRTKKQYNICQPHMLPKNNYIHQQIRDKQYDFNKEKNK